MSENESIKYNIMNNLNYNNCFANFQNMFALFILKLNMQMLNLHNYEK